MNICLNLVNMSVRDIISLLNKHVDQRRVRLEELKSEMVNEFYQYSNDIDSHKEIISLMKKMKDIEDEMKTVEREIDEFEDELFFLGYARSDKEVVLNQEQLSHVVKGIPLIRREWC